MEQVMERNQLAGKQDSTHKLFAGYSKRLLKDLESKGTIRTAVESLNLSVHADDTDALSAELVVTFPQVIFPASLLLKREEVETLKVPGHSVIAAVHHTKGERARTYTEAPFDLMYGFRGTAHVVDLLSPFEMLMYWSLLPVRPPSEREDNPTAVWTTEGLSYQAQCKLLKEAPSYTPGRHYEALSRDDCILLPELPALGGLRHR